MSPYSVSSQLFVFLVSFDEKWKPQLYLACVAGVQRGGKEERRAPLLRPATQSFIRWQTFSLNNWWVPTAALFCQTLLTSRDLYNWIFACPRTPSFQLLYEVITGLWTVKTLNVEVLTNELLTWYMSATLWAAIGWAKWQNPLSPSVVFDRRHQQSAWCFHFGTFHRNKL